MDDARWERRLERERARNAALEKVVEDKTRELYLANERLRQHNEGLEVMVEERTADLRAALEAAEAAGRAKTEFLAQMSHELRTPLHGLNGTIDALTRTELGAEQRRLLDLCQASGARLLRVIGDVLDFSRIESGKLEFEMRPANVGEIVLAAASSFAAAAEQKGLRLTHACVGDDVWMRADSHRLGQVLAKLLSNAVKFTEHGEIALRAEVRRDDGHLTVSWQVRDSGCGMTPEAAERIFDAFRQAEAATTRRFGGTGLGLSIVRGIVEAMGGTIRVETQVGVGTTFTFETRHEACASEANVAQLAPSALDLGGKKVLVVDDHPINRTLCETMLAGCNCELLFAASGAEAILQVARSAPDLVLMDCHMPGMSGLEATRAIRSTGYQNPILAVSADVTTDNATAVVAAGMQGILGKPFRQSDLFESITELLDGSGRFAAAVPEDLDDALPLFAPDSALELLGGHRDMVARLCEVFLEELPGNLDNLRAGVADADAAAQAQFAHSLKGASGVVCAVRLRDLCADLEAKGREGQCQPDRLDRLEAVARETEAALRAWLAACP
ncbi:MAG: ATP-binding protein [Planctomycetota bacterium]